MQQYLRRDFRVQISEEIGSHSSVWNDESSDQSAKRYNGWSICRCRFELKLEVLASYARYYDEADESWYPSIFFIAESVRRQCQQVMVAVPP